MIGNDGGDALNFKAVSWLVIFIANSSIIGSLDSIHVIYGEELMR